MYKNKKSFLSQLKQIKHISIIRLFAFFMTCLLLVCCSDQKKIREQEVNILLKKRLELLSQ